MEIVENLGLFTLIVSLGIFTQAAAGFAAGLVIIPLMGYAGYGVPEGQTVLLIATIPQNIMGVWQFRSSVDWGELRLPVLLRFVGFPLGFLMLCLLDQLPLQQIRRILGMIILICIGVLCSTKPQTREKIPTGWTCFAFLSSGFFAGLTGTGGPMMVLWVQAHQWTAEKVRAFLFSMYLIYTGPALVMLWWKFEERILDTIASVLLIIPVLLLVAGAGLRVGSWLGRVWLRRVTLAILFLVAVVGIVGL